MVKKIQNMETGDILEIGDGKDLTEKGAEAMLEQDKFIEYEGTEKEINPNDEGVKVETLGAKTNEKQDLDEWEMIDKELENPTKKEFPQQWKPEEDGTPEKLRGIVQKVTKTQYGPAAIIEDLNGDEWAVFSGRKVLDDFLENVEKGNKVGLKYLGMKKPEDGGKKYHNYNTVIK